MKNTKTTKRALVSSALVLILCVSMLVGNTFAWFTDTASTSVNKIQAGTLDVALEIAAGTDDDGNTIWESAEGKTIGFVRPEGHEEETILWEPGCTYYTNDFRIINNGNLALKFKVSVTGLDGDSKLNEVIDWDVLSARDNEEYDPDAELSFPYTWSWKDTDGKESYDPLDGEFVLLPGECVYMQLIGEMDSEAGNEYQGLSLDNIAITVFATQYTYEYDSEDNQYDKDAEYLTAEVVKNGLDTTPGNKFETTDLSGYDISTGSGYVVSDASYTTDGILATFDSTYNVVVFSDVIVDCDTFVKFNKANTLILENCDITIAEGGKLVDVSSSDVTQICFTNVTINGVLVTNDNVSSIVSTYCTGTSCWGLVY